VGQDSVGQGTVTLRNFVGGQYVEASSGRVSHVVDPSTGEAYAQAPVSGPADADAALRAAERAFAQWRDTTPAERSLALLRIADAVRARAEDLVAAECRNTGKPVAITMAEELPHGGFKHSGYGKDLSVYGFEDYTRIKHVMSYLGG
jgi:betaine-aldehyde dehydrogenase